MYNEKICQRLRAKIDSSLFPGLENENMYWLGEASQAALS